MRARWASFAIGLWLILAPLVLGYPTVSAVLHEIALGVLVCVVTLAALEWPSARLTLTLPALWLVTSGARIDWGGQVVAANELACGVGVLLLALVPSGKLAGEHGAAKMPA
jgi:hypothetical protein